MNEITDKKAIACNAIDDESEYSRGSLAFIITATGSECLKVLIRSRGGRWIDKWMSPCSLANFRYKTLPPSHPLYTRCDISGFDSDLLEFLALLGAGQGMDLRERNPGCDPSEAT
jgi:hypothetical protein